MTGIEQAISENWSERAARLIHWTSRHLLLVFLLWSLWLSFQFFCLGSDSYVVVHDNGDSNLPARIAFATAIREGDLGYWNPLQMTGLDALAGSALELDSLAFAFVPGWLAYGLLMWLQRFVAGYFTYRLLRDSVKTEITGAVYAGLAYSLYSQYTQPQMGGFTIYDGLALPGLPLLIWILTRFGNGARWARFTLGIALGLALSWNSGYSFAPFVLAAVVLWVVLITQRPRSRNWMTLAGMMAGWFLAELPFLWASMLNGPMAHRADLEVPEIGTGLLREAKLLVGIARLNGVHLAFGLIGLAVSRRNSRALISLWSILFMIVGLVLGYPVIRALLGSQLGFLKGFQFDRFYWTAPFFASVLGGLGINEIVCRLVQNREAGRRAPVAMTLPILCGIALILARSGLIKIREIREWNDGSQYSNLYQKSEVAGIAHAELAGQPFRVATIADPAGLWHPSFAWAYGLETVDGYVTLYPQRYQDFWAHVITPLTRQDDSRQAYFEGWGNRVYLFSPSNGFESLPIRAGQFYDLELLSLANVQYLISPLPVFGEGLELVDPITRDSSAQTDGRIVQTGSLDPQSTNRKLFIYRNTRAFPRTFLAHRVRQYTDAATLLEDLGEATCDDLLSTAFLREDDVGFPVDQLGSGGVVAVTEYGTDVIRLTVDSQSASVLIITNSYSPFWTAWTDGRETDLFPADHAFQGLYVEEGTHRIVLAYSPPYAVRLGDTLSLDGLNGQ